MGILDPRNMTVFVGLLKYLNLYITTNSNNFAPPKTGTSDSKLLVSGYTGSK